MSKLIISVSGLRGVVGQSLTTDVAVRFAVAFAHGLPPGSIFIARDGRASGKALADAISSALCSLGRDVVDANIAATPTFGVLIRQREAAGGVMVTASHNPSQYNGLKLFGGDGRVISAAKGEKVVQRYNSGEVEPHTANHRGQLSSCDDSLEPHLALILATIDPQRIRKRQYRVLLDSNHGAGSALGRRLLEELGCQVTLVGEQADGQFAHLPEPTATNLAGVSQLVTDASADVGFCQDPDADRLAVIDENGRFIGEEYTLALCLNHVLSQRLGAVVTNCSTSRMAEDLAQRHDVSFFRSAVGEANVADLMIEQNAIFGGEGNGGPIDPRVGYVRDSFVGMALILDSMAASGAPVSQLADRLPRYEIHKTKVELDQDQIPAAMEALKSHFADAAFDMCDGLRLDWPGRWLLIRASNTEPIVRIVAEAESQAEAERLCDEATQTLAAY